jgi:hypothetical protein
MLTTKLTEALGGAKPLAGNKWRAKLISADAWGSSAYYTSEALERDGARVFHAGLQMFQDHLSESERWDKPEGSVEKLVGKLASDGEFDPNGPEGPGLYADVEFYPSYISRISEIHKDVGLSVNAQGLTEDGERDGRFGPILVAMLKADSVDVVTRAGAGGKLTSILESDRGLAGTPIETKENQSMTDVTKEDFEAFSNKLLTELPALFAAAVKDAIPATTTATVDTTPITAGSESTATDTTTTTVTDTATEPVIDHAAIIEALRTEKLPALTAAAVIADIKAGKSVEDAVKAQVTLREAFKSSDAETGTVHLQESAKGELHGPALALAILN